MEIIQLLNSSIPVRFEPLVEDDKIELDGPGWSEQHSPIPAVFAAVWPAHIGDRQTFKLVCVQRRDSNVHSEYQRIQGLVRIGTVERRGGFLTGSLLETAPLNRWQLHDRRYSGVGRVLVARLIVDSYLQEGHGKVLVRATPRAATFYTEIGFKAVAPLGYFALSEDGARNLLTHTLISSDSSEQTGKHWMKSVLRWFRKK